MATEVPTWKNWRLEEETDVTPLLTLAACDDLEGFKREITSKSLSIKGMGMWYSNGEEGSKREFRERTPLMIAAMFGSLQVLKYLIARLTTSSLNRACGRDRLTALHCAAYGKSTSIVEVIRLLLHAKASRHLFDANGNKPVDLLVLSYASTPTRIKEAVKLLLTGGLEGEKGREEEEKKEADNFMMYVFKVDECPTVYGHIWNECPYAHPGERLRRRDLRIWPYSWVPCPQFHSYQVCPRGIRCNLAHGAFESELHPGQYRTKLCQYGTDCTRRVCFFAPG